VNFSDGLLIIERDSEGIATKTTITSTFTLQRPDAILDSLSTNLLICSSVVAAEAAAIFYKHNTFHFGRSEIWNPLYDFLDGIGDVNTGYLRNITAEISNPVYMQVDRHGISLFPYRYYNSFKQVHSCGHSNKSNSHRAIHYLDPAIEAYFRILGENKSSLLLRLKLRRFILPGLEVFFDEGDDESSESPPCLITAVPDFVERSRKAFADRVGVLWEGVAKHLFVKGTEIIKEKGWEIVDAKEGQWPAPGTHMLHARSYFTMVFVLRRRQLPRLE
jgi:hypothetical protein